MTIFTDGLRAEPENRGVTDYTGSFGASFGATASETLADSPVSQLLGINELNAARGGERAIPATDPLGNAIGTAQDSVGPAVPLIGKLEAADRVKAAGLEKDLKLPDQDTIAAPALDIMIDRARDRREREATLQRGPQGFLPGALSVGTSFLVGAIDPLNLASAFIPVMGELRYGKLLADAGTSFAGRTAVRLGVGGAQGAVGQAALEPLDWYAHTQDGRDFGMADVLHNLVFGAALGGGLHAAGGGIRDVYRSRKGLAQYPFGPGEPMQHVDGIHVPESVLEKPVAAIRYKGDLYQGRPGEAHLDIAERHGMDLDLGPKDIDADLFVLPGGEVVNRTEMSRRGLPESAEDIYPESIRGDQRIIDGLMARRVDADMPAHLQPVVDRIDQVLADTPAMQILRDLPPRAHEDSMRAALASIVDGEPVKVGEMLHAAAQTDPRIAESFDVYHGSGYSFDRFDVKRINTGEGSQSYGHGLYFAEHPEVAKDYADTLGPKRGGGVYDMDPNSPTFGQFMEMSRGNVYKVRVNADREHFLDWDIPLHQQSEHVKVALKKIYDPMMPGQAHAPIEDMLGMHGHSGEDIYRHVGDSVSNGPIHEIDRAAASKKLREAGIPGIKYLDQGSRFSETYKQHLQAQLRSTDPLAVEMARKELVAVENPTRNFVVFDDKHIEIIDRNGEPVAKPFTESPAGNPKITLGDPDLVAAPKPSGRAAAHPDTLSLNEHLASQGGLRPDPELAAIYGGDRGPFVPGFGPLIRKSGMPLDQALRSAKEHGYMFDAHDVDNGSAGGSMRSSGRTSHGLTPNDLLDHLDAENRGQKLYKAGQLEKTKYDPEQEKHVVLGHVETEFEAAGLKVSDIDGKLLDRTVEIMHREGERDVLAAYERAIMEDEERYHAIAAARRTVVDHIPGWDVHADAGAAPRDGDPNPGDAGAVRRAGSGQRAADRAQSPGDGAGDTIQNLAARDAAWRELAATKPDVADAGLLEASRAADKLPEPVETNLDKRVTAAEKADAYAKQMYDIFKDRLPEPERQRLEDMLRNIDDEAAVRKEAIERSGACLFGARA